MIGYYYYQLIALVCFKSLVQYLHSYGQRYTLIVVSFHYVKVEFYSFICWGDTTKIICTRPIEYMCNFLLQCVVCHTHLLFLIFLKALITSICLFGLIVTSASVYAMLMGVSVLQLDVWIWGGC